VCSPRGLESLTMTMATMTKPSLPLFLALALYLSSHHALSFGSSPAGVVGRSGRVGAVNSPSALDASLSASGASSAADADDDDEHSLLSSPLPTERIQSRQQLRRDVLTSLYSATTVIATTTLCGGTTAYASLLEDYGADPNVNKQPEKATTKKTKELARDKGKIESSMEPNLRSNYYYPTNKGE